MPARQSENQLAYGAEKHAGPINDYKASALFHCFVMFDLENPLHLNSKTVRNACVCVCATTDSQFDDELVWVIFIVWNA